MEAAATEVARGGGRSKEGQQAAGILGPAAGAHDGPDVANGRRRSRYPKERAAAGGRPGVATVHQADFRLSDPRVSPNHCKLSVRNATLFVMDMDSLTGTAVNNMFVTVEYPLQLGDTFSHDGLTIGWRIRASRQQRGDAAQLFISWRGPPGDDLGGVLGEALYREIAAQFM